MANQKIFIDQLRTLFAARPSSAQAGKQQDQLLLALFNVVQAELVDRIMATEEYFVDKVAAAKNPDELREIRARAEDHLDSRMYDEPLQSQALELLARRSDITSLTDLLAEYLVNRWKESKTAPPTLIGRVEQAEPIAGGLSDAASDRLIVSISDSFDASSYMQEVLGAFPDLSEKIEREFRVRVKRLEDGTEPPRDPRPKRRLH